MRRFNIFSENLKKYEEHNQSGASWTMGLNQFSDLTEAEFEAFHMGGECLSVILNSLDIHIQVTRRRPSSPAAWRVSP